MFSDMIRTLPCEVCGEGEIYYSQKETFEAWQWPEIFMLDDVGKLIDGIISEVLVFICTNCEAQSRYTFKEVEKKIRKKLSDRLLTMVAMGSAPDPGAIKKSDRILIYCGKCSGYDGKGSCPRIVYKECELKRAPYGF